MKKEHFYEEEVSAYDALFEAQKIVFAPIIFQVARALCELGILREVDKSGKIGITATEVGNILDISVYGIETLLESGNSGGIVKIVAGEGGYKHRKYALSKTGYCLLHDPMTQVNMDFNHLVCYEGMSKLVESVATGSPKGLEVFGRQWKTLYEALPSLPQNVKGAWDRFDHFYSNAAYSAVLPIILRGEVKCLVDIGANSGEFSILSAKYDPEVELIMVDLPSQIEIALKNVVDHGLEDRITGHAMDVLDPSAEFPGGANVYWLSQFLSCFSAQEIIEILARVRQVMPDDSRVLILETCWDRQQHEASAFSLINTSPYFTCMANGNSKMYHSEELTYCIREAGLELRTVLDNIGICHCLIECVRA